MIELGEDCVIDGLALVHKSCYKIDGAGTIYNFEAVKGTPGVHLTDMNSGLVRDTAYYRRCLVCNEVVSVETFKKAAFILNMP